MTKSFRVLIVDDSAYVRKVLREMLSRAPQLEVVGMARDGAEALDLVEELRPDVVTLDLMMPKLDGVGFLREQMTRRPIPTLVVSIASEQGEAALNALDAGAIDFVQKPTALATEKVFEIADELIRKVMCAAQSRTVAPEISTPASALVMPSRAVGAYRLDGVVIGISTGGPQALKKLIPRLPKDFPVPVGIVLHMPVGYTEMYAQKLNDLSPLEVVEARDGMPVIAGRVLLAQAGRHLRFERDSDGSVVARLDAQPFDSLHRPSVDVLFKSAADVWKGRTLGIVMTGMGSDGQEGAAWIKAQGGQILTEAEETCVVYGMPRSVVDSGLSDRAVPLPALADAVLEAL
jgi:two-component system chemotaxis response regulator CheB